MDPIDKKDVVELKDMEKKKTICATMCRWLQSADVSNICIEYLAWCDVCQFSFSCPFCPICAYIKGGTEHAHGKYNFSKKDIFYVTTSFWQIEKSANNDYYTFSPVGDMDEEDRFLFKKFKGGSFEPGNKIDKVYGDKIIKTFGARPVQFRIIVKAVHPLIVSEARVYAASVGDVVETCYICPVWK